MKLQLELNFLAQRACWEQRLPRDDANVWKGGRSVRLGGKCDRRPCCSSSPRRSRRSSPSPSPAPHGSDRSCLAPHWCSSIKYLLFLRSNVASHPVASRHLFPPSRQHPSFPATRSRRTLLFPLSSRTRHVRCPNSGLFLLRLGVPSGHANPSLLEPRCSCCDESGHEILLHFRS